MLQPNIHLAVLTRRRHEFSYFVVSLALYLSVQNVDTQCIVHTHMCVMHIWEHMQICIHACMHACMHA